MKILTLSAFAIFFTLNIAQAKMLTASPEAALKQLQITIIEMMMPKNQANFQAFKAKQNANFQKWSYEEQILKFKADSTKAHQKDLSAWDKCVVNSSKTDAALHFCDIQYDKMTENLI